MVAVVAASIAFALPSSAMARTDSASPNAVINGTASHSVQHESTGAVDSSQTKGARGHDKPKPHGQPGVDHQPPGQSDRTTTTTAPTTSTLPTHSTKQQGSHGSPKKAATSDPTTVPTTSTTSTSTTAPGATSVEPEQNDQDRSNEAGKASNPQTPPGQSKEKRPADPQANTPEAPPTDETDVGPVEAELTPAVAPGERKIDWSFLTGDVQAESLAQAPVEHVDAESEVSSVVFSWLVGSQAVDTPPAIAGPVLVLLTIWDAAASAGSGLAAPASGLGTFVLIVLFDRTRLGDIRLLRRRSES